MGTTNEVMSTFEITVPGDKIGRVIGARGSMIQEIQRRPGVVLFKLNRTTGFLQVRCSRAAEAPLLDLLGSLIATKRVRPLLALSRLGRSLGQKEEIRLVHAPPASSSRTRLPQGKPGCRLYAPIGRGSRPPEALLADPEQPPWSLRNNRCGFVPPCAAESAILRAQLQRVLQDVRQLRSAGSFRLLFSGGTMFFASKPAAMDASSWFSPSDGIKHLGKGVPFFTSQLFGDVAVVQGILESQGFELEEEEDTVVLHFDDLTRGFRSCRVDLVEAEPFLLRPVADVVKLVAICVLQSAVEGSPMGGRLVLQAGVPLEELSPVVVREVKRAWAERQQTEGLPVLGDSLRATCARRVRRKTFSKGNAALARKWGEVQVCLSRVRERFGSEVKSKEHLEIFVSCPPLLRRVESFARGDHHEDPADLADAMVQFMFAAEEIIASACDVGST